MQCRLLPLTAFILLLSGPAFAQEISFGDDSGEYAFNGECDDPRFTGPGMTQTVLLSSDRFADATDCRTAFEAGRLTLHPHEFPGTGDPVDAAGIDFGDDSGEYVRDGECDDPRFTGPGMTGTPLIEDDVRADATDCSAAWLAGALEIATEPVPVPPVDEAMDPDVPDYAERETGEPLVEGGLYYGYDSSPYAGDGQCDDRRFVGAGMAGMLDWRNVGRDASDCRTAMQAGTVSLWDPRAAHAATQCEAIDWGDDSGSWAFDGECDDSRFEGRGTSNIWGEIGVDASDCRRLCAMGLIAVRDY